MLSIRAFLTADHARLDALLAAACADPPQVDGEAYRELRAGLLRHIAMEEKVLFAEVRAQADEAAKHVTRILHADHAAIASLLVPPPTAGLIASLKGILDDHNPLEDAPGGLYDQVDRHAGDRVSVLLTRMQAIAPVRASQHLDEPRVHAHIERMLVARLEIRR